MRRLYILAGVVGVVVGLLLQARVETQDPALLFGRDSASGLPTVIQTNGSNALKVVGQ